MVGKTLRIAIALVLTAVVLYLSKPSEILAATAGKLPQGRHEVGAGLVDPVQALVKSAPKQALAP